MGPQSCSSVLTLKGSGVLCSTTMQLSGNMFSNNYTEGPHSGILTSIWEGMAAVTSSTKGKTMLAHITHRQGTMQGARGVFSTAASRRVAGAWYVFSAAAHAELATQLWKRINPVMECSSAGQWQSASGHRQVLTASAGDKSMW